MTQIKNEIYEELINEMGELYRIMHDYKVGSYIGNGKYNYYWFEGHDDMTLLMKDIVNEDINSIGGVNISVECVNSNDAEFVSYIERRLNKNKKLLDKVADREAKNIKKILDKVKLNG